MARAQVEKADGTIVSVKIERTIHDHIPALIAVGGIVLGALAFNSRLAAVEARTSELIRSTGELKGSLDLLHESIGDLRSDLRGSRALPLPQEKSSH